MTSQNEEDKAQITKTDKMALDQVFGKSKDRKRFSCDPSLINDANYRIAALLPTGGCVMVKINDFSVYGAKDPHFRIYYKEGSPFKIDEQGQFEVFRDTVEAAQFNYYLHTRTMTGTMIFKRK